MENNITTIDIFWGLIKHPNKTIQSIIAANKKKQLILSYLMIFGFLGFIYPFLEKDLFTQGFASQGQEYNQQTAISLGIMFTWMLPLFVGIFGVLYCAYLHFFATFLMKGKGVFSKTIILFFTILTLIQGIQMPITVFSRNIFEEINIPISIFFVIWTFMLHYKLIKHNYHLPENTFYIGTFNLSLSVKSFGVVLLGMISIALMLIFFLQT